MIGLPFVLLPLVHWPGEEPGPVGRELLRALSDICGVDPTAALRDLTPVPVA